MYGLLAAALLSCGILGMLWKSGSFPSAASRPPVTKRCYALGTFITLTAQGPSAPRALEKAEEFLRSMEKMFSLSASYPQRPILPFEEYRQGTGAQYQELAKILSRAMEYAGITRGAFDPTIGALTSLWNVGTPEERVPSEKDIRQELLRTGYTKLLASSEDQSGTPREPFLLDFGGIAKGYAADQVRHILERHHALPGLINMGGNIVTVGKKPRGKPWKIGIQNPLEPRGNFVGILSLQGSRSVVTSGNYERYFEEEGLRYHHILSPFTGYPAAQDVLGVTVVNSSSLEGDALSTGLYVLGLSQGFALLRSLENVEALFITSDKKILLTPGLEKIFRLTDQEFSLEIRR